MDLEEIKKRKLEELKQEVEKQQLQEHLQVQEQVEQLESIAKPLMTSDAISRYCNLKAVHTEKAIQSIVIITQLAQQGKLPNKVTDEQYKELLVKLTPEKKEFRIHKK